MKYFLITLLFFTSTTNAQIVTEYLDAKTNPIKDSTKATYRYTYLFEGSKKTHPINLYHKTGELLFESKEGAFINPKNNKSTGIFNYYNKNGQLETVANIIDDAYGAYVKTHPKIKDDAFFQNSQKLNFPLDSVTGRAEYSAVIEQKESAERLFTKAKFTIASPSDVGEYESKIEINEDLKKVTRRFTYKVKWGEFIKNERGDVVDRVNTGRVIFTVSITCKDDKYKLRLYDFTYFENFNSGGSKPLEQLFIEGTDEGNFTLADKKFIIKQLMRNLYGAVKSNKVEIPGFIEKLQVKMMSFLTGANNKNNGKDKSDDF